MPGPISAGFPTATGRTSQDLIRDADVPHSSGPPSGRQQTATFAADFVPPEADLPADDCVDGFTPQLVHYRDVRSHDLSMSMGTLYLYQF